jgi:hypothetical protein
MAWSEKLRCFFTSLPVKIWWSRAYGDSGVSSAAESYDRA